MREIKFRGKRVDNGEWVYGSLIQRIGYTEIFDDVFTWVIVPETIGQYTGLKDKNDTEIYEGDVVRAGGSITEVSFFRGCFYTVIHNSNYRLSGWKTLEVIGNIHDNPELLKE